VITVTGLGLTGIVTAVTAVAVVWLLVGFGLGRDRRR